MGLLSDIGGWIFGGKSGDSTDDARVIAEQSAATSREALAWAKEVFAAQAPERAAAEKRAQEVSDAQLRGMNFAVNQAQELDAYNKETFRPIEKKFVADASTYDTADRRMGAAASAAADVDMSADAARRANDRALGRAGIAPGSARALALAEDSAVAQAAARGGAMTQAARSVEQQGYSRMADAVGLGRGLAPTQATQQQIATSSGSAATAASGQALSATMAGNGGVQQGYSTAINGLNAAGNLYTGIAGQQLAQEKFNFQQAKEVGNAIGMAFSSDKNLKEGTGRMASATKALAEIEATPVHEGWNYKADPKRKSKTGPMAQDVRSSMGEAVAPGGKVIDVVSMNGKMMAAIQALAKDVRELKREEEREAA